MPFRSGQKVEATDNNVQVWLDEDVLERKVGKAIGDESALPGMASLTAWKLRNAMARRQGMGACLAISCLWLERVLTSQNPWLPKLADLRGKAMAEELQAAYQTKTVTNAAKQLGAGQAVDVVTAERGAFASWALKRFGLVVVPDGTRTGVFSDKRTPGAIDVVSAVQFRQTIEQLMAEDRAAYVISIALIGGSHAMAMYVHGDQIYVLDPNFGVFRYNNRATAAGDMRLLLRGNDATYAAAAGKDWSITQLRRL
jgi:hypothetical protein